MANEEYTQRAGYVAYDIKGEIMEEMLSTQKWMNQLRSGMLKDFQFRKFMEPCEPRKRSLGERVASSLCEAVRRIQDAYKVLRYGAELEDYEY